MHDYLVVAALLILFFAGILLLLRSFAEQKQAEKRLERPPAVRTTICNPPSAINSWAEEPASDG